jgi:putative sterol carrier protein
MTVVRYPSPEWLEESLKTYQASPEMQEELRKITVKIFFRIGTDPAWGLETDLYFGGVLEKGQLLELAFASEQDAKARGQFIMGATPQVWKKVLTKESKALTELMLRRIVLEQGSMTEALGLMPHAPALIDALTKTELRFPDDMDEPELAGHKKFIQEFRARLGV